MTLVILGADDVEGILSKIAPDTLTKLMATVFVRLSKNDGVAVPHRAVISSGSYNTLFMPSSLSGIGTSIKTVSVPSSGVKGSTTASSLLLDEETGAVKALINAGSLTALRTASGSLLATKLLISVTPKVLVAFGAGAQVEAHIRILLHSYETITRCIIVNRTLNNRLSKLREKVASAFPRVSLEIFSLEQPSKLESIVSVADIICTATPSRAPLFDGKWVKAGTHINLVGSYTPEMVEVDDHLIRRCGRVVVDSQAACMSEAGELIKAGIDVEDILEIGDIMKENGEARDILTRQIRAGGEITIFKSVGIGLQDTAIAALVYERAHELGIGQRVDSFH